MVESFGYNGYIFKEGDCGLMDVMFDTIARINAVINDFIWVKIGLVALIGCGLYLSIRLKFFQLLHLKMWLNHTIGSIFKHDKTGKNHGSAISQFQSLCTALAATIGTGNIAGVAAAIVIGGPGSIFWMWVAAFFGMMTKFCEEVLGLFYRRKNNDGEWNGGAMYYLKDGLGKMKYGSTIAPLLATLFAFFTILASFGIGNMSQVNKAILNIKDVFFGWTSDFNVAGVSGICLILGIILMIVTGFIILGGLKRIASFAEKVVPFMAIFYVVGSIILLISHASMIPDIFASIFRLAFSQEALAGGVSGSIISQALIQGLKRGAFSNEAGLGSSVMAHSASDANEPVVQGMWGIFEVFVVTFVICTMSALVVLSSGYIDLTTGMAQSGISDATLISTAFEDQFGFIGAVFIAVATFLFAFTTLVGWSQYGSKAVEYVFGAKGVKPYKIIYLVVIVFGAVMTSSLAWDISDTFNGFMMIPNLIGLLCLSPLVVKIVKNYLDRTIYKKDIEPLLHYDQQQ